MPQNGGVDFWNSFAIKTFIYDVESSMGEITHKFQLNLFMKIKDNKNIFDQERALLSFFKLHDMIITTEDSNACCRLQEKGIQRSLVILVCCLLPS